MVTSDKSENLAQRFIHDTQNGDMSWHVAEPPTGLVSGTESLISIYLESIYKEQIIGVAIRRFPRFDIDYERFFWNEEYVLCFVDDSGRILWEYSNTVGYVYSLIQVARNSAIDIKSMFSKFLDGDS